MIAVKQTGLAKTMPYGLFLGVLGAVAATLAGAAVTAKLMDQQILETEQTGYAVMVILIAASWLGARISRGAVKRQKAKVCLLTGGCFFLVLTAATALLFGGRYDGVGETALLVFCGSMLAILGNQHNENRRNRRKPKIRNR